MEKMEKMYAIMRITHYGGLFDYKEYDVLAWQIPAWDEDGYFWTAPENFLFLQANNTCEHRFIFFNKFDADKLMHKLFSKKQIEAYDIRVVEIIID